MIPENVGDLLTFKRAEKVRFPRLKTVWEVEMIKCIGLLKYSLDVY